MPVVFIRGLPNSSNQLSVPRNVSVFNHLPSAEMEEQLGKASFVIGRCGYSTVMDLTAMQKRSILIPTPGQTEQEYLAAHLQKTNVALCIDQQKFRLKNALSLAATFPYKRFYPSTSKPAIVPFITHKNNWPKGRSICLNQPAIHFKSRSSAAMPFLAKGFGGINKNAPQRGALVNLQPFLRQNICNAATKRQVEDNKTLHGFETNSCGRSK